MPGLMIENQMGPNAVWLMEWLTDGLSLQPGTRVLSAAGAGVEHLSGARVRRVWAAAFRSAPTS